MGALPMKIRSQEILEVLAMSETEAAVRGGSQGPEQAVLNVALALMREVKEDLNSIRTEVRGELRAMSEQLVKLSDERREEAREHGALEARLKSLEEFRTVTQENTRTNRRIAYGALASALGTGVVVLIVIIWKLSALHPETLPK